MKYNTIIDSNHNNITMIEKNKSSDLIEMSNVELMGSFFRMKNSRNILLSKKQIEEEDVKFIKEIEIEICYVQNEAIERMLFDEVQR